VITRDCLPDSHPALHADEALFVADLRSQIGAYLELSKARLSALVVFTTFAGFLLASPAAIDWGRALLTVLGTTLAAFGANALNQWIEAARDARMLRTARRPLPSGRLTPGRALLFGLLTGLGGPLLLAVTVNAASAALALLTLLIYVAIYTPLKTRTSLNTLVGAVVGGLPPLIGWVAVAGEISTGGWILAAILFVWQVPHFLALAWMYREDYERGGYRMLPQLDDTGRLTGFACSIYSLALVPLVLLLSLSGRTGLIFAVGGAALALWLSLRSLQLWLHPERAVARRLFLTSVMQLPLLLGLMLADRQPVGLFTTAAEAVRTGWVLFGWPS
jgi:protoheme IX farnesyltransferase